DRAAGVQVIKLSQAVRASRATSMALAVAGVLWGDSGAYISDIKAPAAAGDVAYEMALVASGAGSMGSMQAAPAMIDRAGMALMAAAVGSMVSMQLAPAIIARAGRAMMPVAGAIAALAALSPLAAADTAGLALALFVMGASVAMLDISANIRLSVEEAARGLPLMNLAHAAFSFAFAIAALAAALARRAGWPPEQFLPLSAAAIL